MAIIKGAISFGSNFNIGAKGPIDSRMRVETKADLTTVWTAEIPAFEGMSVVTMDTGKIWVLVGKDYTVESNWKEPSPKPVIDATNYTDAIGKATTENIGQIVNISNEESVGNVTYSAGLYIVTGAGSVAKLGTTTASGDLTGDVEKLKGDVNSLQSTVGKLDGDENAEGSVKKLVKDGDDAVKVQLTKDKEELEGKINAVEAAAKASHTVVSDKAEGHVKVSTATDGTGKKTVTISEEDIASKSALDALTNKVGTEATTGETTTSATGLYKYVDDKVAGVPKYKVVKNDNGGFNLVVDGQAITDSAEISFADYMVREGKVVKGTWNENGTVFTENTDESSTGTDTAIKLVLNTKSATGEDASETIYIDARSLVDVYTVAEGSTEYITINGYKIAITDSFKTIIGKVSTIETGLGELKTKVETLDGNSLKEITVNGHTINSGATTANIVTKEIKTGEEISADGSVTIPKDTTIDDVVKGIYTKINELNGSKIENVTAVDKSGVKVDSTDAKNPKVSLVFETPTNDTIGKGHLAVKVNDSGELYAEMYYLGDDAEA